MTHLLLDCSRARRIQLTRDSYTLLGMRFDSDGGRAYLDGVCAPECWAAAAATQAVVAEETPARRLGRFPPLHRPLLAHYWLVNWRESYGRRW